MGKFGDAVKAGEMAPDKDSENRALRRAWIDTVLDPVIANVNEDIKAYNLKFSTNVKEDSYSIFVELLFFGRNPNPLNLTITVGNDLDVMIYIMSGQGINIGTAVDPNRLQLEDQLVDFLRLQSSLDPQIRSQSSTD
jgi:hypothetical protein